MGRLISSNDISLAGGSKTIVAAGRSGPMWGAGGGTEITLFSGVVPGGSVPPSAVLRFKGLLTKYAPNSGGFGITIRAKQGANTVALGQQSLGATLAMYSFEHHVGMSDDLKWGFPFSRTINLFDVASPSAGTFAGNLYSTGGSPSGKTSTAKGAVAFCTYSSAPIVENAVIDWSQDVTITVVSNPVVNDCVELLSFFVESIASASAVVSVLPKSTIFMGDSLTAGTGASSAGVTDYLSQLGKLRPGRSVLNDGMGGQNITAIVTRALASQIAGKYWDMVLWAGGNDGSADAAAWWATMNAQIDRLIAYRAAGTKLIICNIIPSRAWEAGVVTAMLAVNANLAATYGTLVCDVYTPIATDGGLPPLGILSDGIAHLNDTGYGLVAAAVDAKMTALGWA